MCAFAIRFTWALCAKHQRLNVRLRPKAELTGVANPAGRWYWLAALRASNVASMNCGARRSKNRSRSRRSRCQSAGVPAAPAPAKHSDTSKANSVETPVSAPVTPGRIEYHAFSRCGGLLQFVSAWPCEFPLWRSIPKRETPPSRALWPRRFSQHAIPAMGEGRREDGATRHAAPLAVTGVYEDHPVDDGRSGHVQRPPVSRGHH